VTHSLNSLQKLNELLTYLADDLVPEFVRIKEYKAIMNACKLLKIITILIKKIDVLELLLSHKPTFDWLLVIALKPF
jgi:hypothetical protein